MEEFRCEPSTLFDTSILNPCSIPLTEMEFVAHYKDLQGIMADEYPTMNVMMNYVNPDGGPSKIYAGLDYSDALTNSVSIGFGIGDNGSLGSDHAGKKRKIMLAPESSSDVSSDENSANKNNFGKGKTGKHKQQKVSGSGGEREKPKEVIHVRARRGQATDSHSLAERVRREKINERMRCLQELVPGCYKTMGMAVMLEEIINYVQSLQNQVEFLSMKLSAATSSYDFHTNVVAQEMHQICHPKNGRRRSNGAAVFEAINQGESAGICRNRWCEAMNLEVT